MSLRARLLLALLLAFGLTLLLSVWTGQHLLRRGAEQATLAALESRLEGLDRERCESEDWPRRVGLGPPRQRLYSGRPPFEAPQPGPPRPERAGPLPGRHRRGMGEVSFYRRDFSPRWPGTRPLPPEMVQALKRESGFVFLTLRGSPEGFGEVLAGLPTGWDSELCAYAVSFRPVPPEPFPPGGFALAAVGLLAVLCGAIWVAAASPVRRIRALREAVSAAARAGYAQHVAVQGQDEVAGLARAFNDASATVRARLEELEQRERTLREFVANTTHDVGLPLSVLNGQLAALRAHAERGEPAPAELLSGAAQEARYISSLLHNLGVVVQLDTEAVLTERHPVDLVALVERVALRHAGLARDAGVELNHAGTPEPAQALGDVTLIEQAVSNLVHNAVSYNRPGGHVALVLESAGQGVSRRFELRVTDDGPGLDDADLARLDQPRFRSEEARSRRPEGLGLGITIARTVAQRHGFSLQFQRSEAGGLEVTLAGSLV